ncbi:MAG: acyloxyacyl hydrolase [Opitutales bacterium]
MRKKSVSLLIGLVFLFSSLTADSESFRFDRIGFRAGMDAESGVNIESYEIFGVVATPWLWDLKEDWKLLFEFEWSAGVFDGEGETAGFFKFAPQLRFQAPKLPVHVILSSGPSLITEDKFGKLDLGGVFQFTSAVGIDWQINESWTVGYRFQHISNAGIYSNNDGLDLHSLSVDFRF